ncbi:MULTISPECIES: endonuclease/exonuclease/phosphatase family protein [Sphingobacterium]|uniref:Endonuclease n=1 Tax=Sphingobacterium cellulitidis TaxID=1768011 RepID=A0A8H9KVH6_9SPHI|nr:MULTISPECIES: endonuclease/exonuclease/phosphatase family protein [Sphingobacterium]MBA8987281.1 endonuclease/exonuclease/phosphatase family metal-dependent hydrolase [Sphingobacterium soli]OYD40630.1 endonuclease [Sphingobacterium cellulitidis]OYD44088.1 endonuclease [Sphingobacterium cellulitidis]WFB63009.1 endonuclease/exonuclease/phosphatase family protein [Sphingobacterium sp. WM]GGE31412.1 endonuclease [Sphingobacterium soli]
MKKLLVSLSLLLCMVFSYAQKMNVATFNIRMKTNSDVGNLWADRYTHLTDLIKYHEFEIFGVQEAFKEQLNDMSSKLVDFKYIGVGRDDGADKGEHSAIFYDTKRFEVSKNGTFWLSPTDTEKPNKGWDAALPRICTWGIFKDKSNGKKFIFMNTHFDHIGVEARRESAKLILAKAKEFAKDLPLILTGDFNIDETNEAYFTLAKSGVVQDVYDLAKIKYEPNSSFNGWGKSLVEKARIDHIFITKPFKVRKYGILTDTYMGKFPSDHFPVLAELSWK